MVARETVYPSSLNRQSPHHIQMDRFNEGLKRTFQSVRVVFTPSERVRRSPQFRGNVWISPTNATTHFYGRSPLHFIRAWCLPNRGESLRAEWDLLPEQKYEPKTEKFKFEFLGFSHRHTSATLPRWEVWRRWECGKNLHWFLRKPSWHEIKEERDSDYRSCHFIS